MIKKILIIATITFVGCSTPTKDRETTAFEPMESPSIALPAGFTIVEKQTQGLFIRLSSMERATISTIQTIATSADGQYDRIDFCLDAAHERGDEYASIIAGRIFDYQNDTIYNLNPIKQ